MNQPDITFIITSVIHFSQNKLSYSQVRSVYTPEQREQQTLHTITSIREKVPNASIVLVEMGLKKNISRNLLLAADQFIYVGNNWLVKWACNSRHKGLGEAMGLIKASSNINTSAGLYFKISGRYFLNNDFKLDGWNNRQYCFKKYGDNVSTRLYSFGPSFFSHWKRVLYRSLPLLYKGYSIEEVMPRFIPPGNIYEMKLLGVSGFVAPNAESISE